MNKPGGKISVGCMDENTHWEFHVADNGPGVEQKYHKKIFKMFQTLFPKDGYGSTGIGLAVEKEIVELHGGKIWLKLTPGQDCTFFFTLLKDTTRISNGQKSSS